MNIASEYISFSQNSIKKYLMLILDHYFDQNIYDDMINAYINTRYYNLYPSVSLKLEENIVYYLKKSVLNIDEKFKDKARYMFKMFKYMLYFDGAFECDSVRKLISEIKMFRLIELKLSDSNFESKLYNMLEEDLLAKKNFLDSFSDKNFSMKYLKVKDNIFYCTLEHNLKFSKLYSEYAIEKVFSNKTINEQKLFVSYSLACVRALEDVVKGNFDNVYIVDYVFSLVSKPKKNQRLLKTIDNDIIKEKLVLKIKYSDYISNHDWVYDLTRRGFKIALDIDSSFEFNEENNKLFKIFAFIITSDKKLYDSSQYEIIYIPS
ncbi:MAG: hypothetical protein IKF91_04575 [Bacilli bacterium]|nr:hypothetical protein [Bacilli bacterium]